MSGPAVWQIPERHLGEDGLAAAHEAIRRCEAELPVGLAVVSGSLVMGLGHALSDLDIYVTSADNSPVPIRGFSNGGFSVQVTPITVDKLRQLAAHGNSFRVSSADRTQLGLGVDDNKLLFRLVNGTVLKALPEFAALVATIDIHAVRQLTILRHASHAVELQEDVRGALDSADPMTALVASHRALLHAVEAGLAGVGEIYDHEKVALRRLARHAGTSHLLAETWQLLSCGPPLHAPLSEVADLAIRRCLLVSHLTGHAVLTGWERPTGALPQFNPRSAGPIRSYHFGVLRFTDGIALTGSDYGARITEPMARLWLACDGGSSDELVHSPLLSGFSADTTKLERALARLVEVSAVEEMTATS